MGRTAGWRRQSVRDASETSHIVEVRLVSQVVWLYTFEEVRLVSQVVEADVVREQWVAQRDSGDDVSVNAGSKRMRRGRSGYGVDGRRKECGSR